MANTYTQIYFHIVFAVKGRTCHIANNWKEELYKYITGVIFHKDQKMIRINGMQDHVHILIGLKPNIMLSDLVRDLKSSSSKWINEKGFIKEQFSWQKGFGAFSVSHSELPKVINYIINQEQHHKTISFKEEYLNFVK